MKVVIISDSYPPEGKGGAEIIAATQAYSLAKLGHEVHVITSAVDSTTTDTINGVTVHFLPIRYPQALRPILSVYNPFAVRKIARLLVSLKPDVIHVHNVHKYSSWAVLGVTKKYAPKTFITLHDAMSVSDGKVTKPEQKSRMRNRLISRYVRMAHVRLAVSEALKEVLVANGITDVKVLHNSISAEAWEHSDPDLARHKFGIASNHVILFAGRISGSKGFFKLIEAYASVLVSFPDTVLVVAGDASPEAKKKARALFPLIDKVVFTGWLPHEEMKSLYAAATVVIVPSLYIDPFPTVNLEAMASGKPVVATSMGGSKEIVEDRVTGFVVNPEDAKEIADKIVLIFSNPQTGSEMGNRGLQRVQTKFNMQSWVNTLLSWYAS